MFDSKPFDVTDEPLAIFEAVDGVMSGEIFNPDGNPTIYVGPSDVSVAGATRGRPVYAGDSFSVDLRSSDSDVYVIAATSGPHSVQKTWEV